MPQRSGRVARLSTRFEPGIILEGGAVDFNGQGSVLTSEQCLLNPNRNPQLNRAPRSSVIWPITALRANVIWLGDGIVGDDTDGHIDELARFVGPRIVVAAVEDDPADENYAALADNLRRLELATDEARPAAGDRAAADAAAAALQWPASAGQLLNFYIANGVVIVPQFDDPADAAACRNARPAVSWPPDPWACAVELVWGLGTFHCITQQQPTTG